MRLVHHFEVPARGEHRSGRCQEDRANLWITVEPIENRGEFAMQRRVEAIEHLWPDQPDIRHMVHDLQFESLIGHRGHYPLGDVKSNDCEMITFMISLEPP